MNCIKALGFLSSKYKHQFYLLKHTSYGLRCDLYSKVAFADLKNCIYVDITPPSTQLCNIGSYIAKHKLGI